MTSNIDIDGFFSEIDTAISEINSSINDADLKNKEYLFWVDRHTRIVALIEEAQAELLRNKGLLKGLEKSYEKEKLETIAKLECGITDTLNTWYTGEQYNIKLEKVPKSKTEQYYLSDANMESSLETICGGSAAQVSGSLILSSVLESEGSSFILFDEAYCNTDSITAKDIGELLSDGLSDKQIILIENKIDLTDNVVGLKYYLYYTKETGTGVIKVEDDYCELDPDSIYQEVNDPSILIDITKLLTEDEYISQGVDTIPYKIV